MERSTTLLKSTTLPAPHLLLDPNSSSFLRNPQPGKHMRLSSEYSDHTSGHSPKSTSSNLNGSPSSQLNPTTITDRQFAEPYPNIPPVIEMAQNAITTGQTTDSGRQMVISGSENTNGQLLPSNTDSELSMVRPTTPSINTNMPLPSSSITTQTNQAALQPVTSMSQARYLEQQPLGLEMARSDSQTSLQSISPMHRSIDQISGDGTMSQSMDGIMSSSQGTEPGTNLTGIRTRTPSLLDVSGRQPQTPSHSNQIMMGPPPPQIESQVLPMRQQDRSNYLRERSPIRARERPEMTQSMEVSPRDERTGIEMLLESPDTSQILKERLLDYVQSRRNNPSQSQTLPALMQNKPTITEITTNQATPITFEHQAPLEAVPLDPLPSQKQALLSSVPTLQTGRVNHQTIQKLRHPTRSELPVPVHPTLREGSNKQEQPVQTSTSMTSRSPQTTIQSRIPRPITPLHSSQEDLETGSTSLSPRQRLLAKYTTPRALPPQVEREMSKEMELAEQAQHLNTHGFLKEILAQRDAGRPMNNQHSIARMVNLQRPEQNAFNQGMNAMNEIPLGEPGTIRHELNNALVLAKRASTMPVRQVLKRSNLLEIEDKPPSQAEKRQQLDSSASSNLALVPSTSSMPPPATIPERRRVPTEANRLKWQELLDQVRNEKPPQRIERNASISEGLVDAVDNSTLDKSFKEIIRPSATHGVDSTAKVRKLGPLVKKNSFFSDTAKHVVRNVLEGGLNLGRDWLTNYNWSNSARRRSLPSLQKMGTSRNTVIKVIGDRPQVIPGKKITGDSPMEGEDVAKITGDKPFADPNLRKIAGDAPEQATPIDTPDAGADDSSMAAAQLTGYYSSILAGIKLRSSTNTVSMAGVANSYTEMLNTVLANAQTLNLKYGENDIPNVCFVPGMSIHLAESNFYQREGTDDDARPAMIGSKGGPRVVWQMNWTQCPLSISLAPGFDLETLQAVVAVGGTQTMFTTTIKNYSSTFFNADILLRLMSVAGDAYSVRSGYAFQEALLRHALDIVSKYPVPGDEMSQLCDPIGWTFHSSKPTYYIPKFSCFPFTKRDAASKAAWNLQMRIVGYDAFAKQIAKFPDAANPWDANWTMDKFWPYNTDEFTGIAIVYLKASELSSPMLLMRRMLNRLQWPYCMKMYKLTPFVWNFDKTGGEWEKTKHSNYYHNSSNGLADQEYIYGYQVAHSYYLPGPVRKVLFVVTDYMHDDNLKLDFQAININGSVTSLHNSPFVTFKTIAQASREFPFENWLYTTINSPHYRSEFDTVDTLEMSVWEHTYGSSNVIEAVNMIVRNTTALWGMPKYVIPPRGSSKGEFMGYVTHHGKGTAHAPWKSQMVDQDDFGPACETTLNDCGYSVPTGYTNPITSGWHLSQYGVWFDFEDVKFTDFNYTVYHRNPLIDFLMERGYLYMSLESNQNRISDSIFGYVLSLREQGIMWAGLIDGMRQVLNQQWNNIYYNFDKWPGDTRIASITQCIYNQETYIHSGLLGAWNKFTTIERPVWNLRAKMPKLVLDVLMKTFFNKDFMMKSICPIGRVSHFVMCRYDMELSYSDSLITFRGFEIMQGVAWNLFRRITHKKFIDLIEAWVWGSNAHNRMLRKVSMSYFPGCNTSNTVALIGMERPQEILLFPFIFIPPTSGLCFTLAYSAIQDFTYSLSGPKYSSIPLGYQLNNVSMSRESNQYLAFHARSMISAIMGMSADYTIVVAPTSIEGFITDIVPPVLMDAYLFRPFSNALDSA
nr:TPA_asm: hypothetical protein [Becan tricladivirus 3]